MEKVYSIKYWGDGSNPPTVRTRPALSITSGKLLCVTIPCIPEGFLDKLSVEQASGPSVAFTVELLDSVAPYATGLSDVAIVPAADVRIFRVIEQQQISSGDALEAFYQGFGIGFRNQDGTYSDSNRFLYLVIIPTGSSATTTWNVSLTVHH